MAPFLLRLMGDLKPSSFIRRILAVIIDFLFILIFGIALGRVVGFDLAKFTFSAFTENEPGWDYFPLIKDLLGIPAAITWLSFGFGIVESFGIATPGKFLLKLRIFGPNLDRFDYSLVLRASIKYFLPISTLIAGFSGSLLIASIGQVVFVVTLAGFFVGRIFFNKALYDLCCRTEVFRV